MALVKPFAALRPRPDWAGSICELPYDVMSSAEAREMAAGNPRSFLHVSKPEIDLPESIDVYDPQVYAKGVENFKRMIADGTLRQDPQACFYFYRQIMGKHIQTGLVAVASSAEYRSGIIKKHEFTRPDKEDDRVRHMEALNSQTGPVFLLYKAAKAFDEFAARVTKETPDTDFTARDGIRHTSWTVRNPADIQFIAGTFQKIPCLYIADGHHRSAAASRVDLARKGAGESGFFLSVIFPHDQMQILPYHRVLKDLNGLTPDQLLKKLETIFTVTRAAQPQPQGVNELGFISTASGERSGSAPNTARRRRRWTGSMFPCCNGTCSGRFLGWMTPARASAFILWAAFAARRNWKNLSTARNSPAPLPSSPPGRGPHGHCRRRRGHAAEEHLVRAQAARRHVLPHAVIEPAPEDFLERN